MKLMATFVALLLFAIAETASGAESPNYPGDLTKGKHLTIYVEGLADPSSGFFRVLNNGAQQAGDGEAFRRAASRHGLCRGRGIPATYLPSQGSST